MKMLRVTFGAPRRAIDFLNCEDVVDGLAQICRGWNLKVSRPVESDPVPDARVSFRRDRWQWQSFGAPKPRDWDRIPPRSSMRVLTDVQDAMLHWHLDDHRRFIGLHAAGVQIGSHLACFPASGFSGKSTLVAALARRGHKAFGDDVVLIGAQGRKAASLGFSPRLRTPLPTDLSAQTRKFLQSHSAPASNGWAYVQTGATLGEQCSITSIVLLERTSEGRARLTPCTALESLKALLAEHLPGRQPLPHVFDCMKRLASTASGHRLCYNRADDAAALLERKLT